MQNLFKKMKTESDLIQKLILSKKIMDKHKEIPRGSISEGGIETFSTPELQNFEKPNAAYNIPTEFLTEEQISKPIKTNNSPITEEKIQNSKLPDEIKRLMIEHPIEKPQNVTPTLSDDLVTRASRLMGSNNKNINEVTKKSSLPKYEKNSTINKLEIATIVRETIEEVLKENGLLIESTQKTKDNFTFRVGQHIFEGKLTKIKKVS